MGQDGTSKNVWYDEIILFFTHTHTHTHTLSLSLSKPHLLPSTIKPSTGINGLINDNLDLWKFVEIFSIH
jgi:hypothetical protein